MNPHPHLKYILGSASPRRKELLAKLDISFTVRTFDFDEDVERNIKAFDQPEFIAKRKSGYFKELASDTCLITADTSVILEDSILNKPANYDEAYGMLKRLQGKDHWVVSGVAIRLEQKVASFSEHTKVHFLQLTDGQIDHYINKYKPFDKAGAYGIQEWIGCIGVERIEGCFYNVMGLPLSRLYKELISL